MRIPSNNNLPEPVRKAVEAVPLWFLWIVAPFLAVGVITFVVAIQFGPISTWDVLKTGDAKKFARCLDRWPGVMSTRDRMQIPMFLKGVDYGHTDCVREMVRRGVNVHATGCWNTIDGHWNAFHLAPNTDIAQILFDAGVDINALSGRGETPLDIANRQGKTDVAEFLKSHGGKTAKELP